VLQEPEGGRRLPIWVGPDHALELALRLLGHGSQLARPLTSDPAAAWSTPPAATCARSASTASPKAPTTRSSWSTAHNAPPRLTPGQATPSRSLCALQVDAGAAVPASRGASSSARRRTPMASR
jgi:hypothetical protein